MGFDLHLDANQLAAWLEGGLPERQRRQWLRHLSSCEACRAWVVCAQTAGEALPPREARGREPLPVFTLPAYSVFWRWQAPLGAAAAVVLVAAVVWQMPRTQVLRSISPANVHIHVLPAGDAPAHVARPHLQAPSRAAAPRPRSFGAAAAAMPQLPTVSAPAPAMEAAVQPRIDFSPLLTGFQDQPMLPIARSALAAWDGGAVNRGGATTTPAVSITSPESAAPTLPGGAAWPFSSSFADDSPSQGPLAPRVASSLGWAISRGGEVLRSIGAGIWQTVPLVPGVHFRALAEIGDSIWAGGRADQLFYSPDKGAHWRAVRLPKLGSNPSALESISFYDTHHGTVMSQNGRVWVTSDGGATWTAE